MRHTASIMMVMGLLLVLGCESDAAENNANTPKNNAQPRATATIQPAQKHAGEESITGTVTFRQDGDTLIIVADLQGFNPDSTHGIHIHESGDLSAPDLSSAKGHFNPAGKHHGGTEGDNRHGGDLGNITADAQGKVHKEWRMTDITLRDGDNSVVDRSVIIHAGEDDLKTDPAGDSGARIAGGVIQLDK